jgi:hypothetical protein
MVFSGAAQGGLGHWSFFAGDEDEQSKGVIRFVESRIYVRRA